MKSTLMILVLTFICFGAHGSVIEFNFEYLKTSAVVIDDHKDSFLGALSEVLMSEEMGGSGVVQPFYVDEIFSTPDMKRSTFVKLGYEVSDKILLNKVMETSEGFLFHSHTKKGVPYALMFKGMELSRVNRVINSLKYTSFEKTTFRMNPSWSIFQNAFAEEENCDDDSNTLPRRLMTTLTQNPLTRCLVGTALGLRDNVAGAGVTFSAVARGLAAFAKNPAQSSRDVWNGSGNFWRGLQEFKNIALREIDRFSQGFRTLPTNKKAEVICRVAYMLSVQMGAAWFTSGASLVTLPASIRETLREIEKDFTVPGSRSPRR